MITKDEWPEFHAECYRVLKPGYTHLPPSILTKVAGWIFSPPLLAFILLGL